MDAELRRYLNGVVVMLSIIVGALLTGLVLPASGEAVNPGSILLWTGLSALLIGGSMYWLGLRPSVRPPIDEVAE